MFLSVFQTDPFPDLSDVLFPSSWKKERKFSRQLAETVIERERGCESHHSAIYSPVSSNTYNQDSSKFFLERRNGDGEIETSATRNDSAASLAAPLSLYLFLSLARLWQQIDVRTDRVRYELATLHVSCREARRAIPDARTSSRYNAHSVALYREKSDRAAARARHKSALRHLDDVKPSTRSVCKLSSHRKCEVLARLDERLHARFVCAMRVWHIRTGEKKGGKKEGKE